MSSRQWNTAQERQHSNALSLMSEAIADRAEEEAAVYLSDSSSVLEGGIEHFGLFALSEEAYMVSAFYHKAIFTPIVDNTIDWGKQLRRINDFSESECLLEFRFRRADLKKLATLIWVRFELIIEGTYDAVRVINKYVAPFETGLMIVLARLSRPRRLRGDLERLFGMRKSHLSAVLSTFSKKIYNIAYPYLSNPNIYLNRIALYASIIHRKCGLVDTVWGFIDGTLRPTCRPTRFQRLAYSGHKRRHGLKFQSVVTPDGLLAMMFGPIPGSRHNSFMLAESNLLPSLDAIMPHGGIVYSLYGDPAYPQSQLLFGGFRGAQPGSAEANWNTQLSKVREVVEWGFKEIIQQWTYLDSKASMRIFLIPVARYYMLVPFLQLPQLILWRSDCKLL